jgi:hypothetical protein
MWPSWRAAFETYRWLWAEVRWLAKSLGYWIRPYDMLADARRWRWQPRQRCGWSYHVQAKEPADPSWIPEDR